MFYIIKDIMEEKYIDHVIASSISRKVNNQNTNTLIYAKNGLVETITFDDQERLVATCKIPYSDIDVFVDDNKIEQFSDFANELAQAAHGAAQILNSDGGPYGEKYPGAAQSILLNVFWPYGEKKPLFQSICESAIRIAGRHAFHNGNKRTGFLVMEEILHIHGFNFKIDREQMIKFFEEKMVEVVQRYSNNEDMDVISNDFANDISKQLLIEIKDEYIRN